MDERLQTWWSAIHTSVFAKLMAIMVTLAACLLLLVTLFFWLAIAPRLNTTIHRMTQPEGRGHSSAHASSPAAPRETVASSPDAAHAIVLAVLLFVMAAVVLSAHRVLNRLLQPLRALTDGVDRLSAGQLDVVVTTNARDEFGRLTDAFNQMVGRVRDMVRARDQLLLDVSHELRSPVTRLKVALELVPDTGMKARMSADVAEMEIMIGELLELERLRDGPRISRVRHNVVSIVADVAGNFRDRPPNVRVVPGKPEILVDIDPDRIRTVIRNLLENAIKFSLPDSRPVEVFVGQNGEQAVIRVTDDGPGVPEADMSRVFEPFFRVDRSRSRKTGGYGLGLSIARRIVEAHGGLIAVENHPQRGVSFIVTLPGSYICAFPGRRPSERLTRDV
jgi:signal transduction histidine kinase